MKRITTILGSLIALMLLLGGCTNKHVEMYNKYVNGVRKHVVRGDKVLTEIQASAKDDGKLKKGADGWLKTISEGRVSIEKQAPADPEVAVLHEHILKRQIALEDALKAMKKGLETGDKAQGKIVRAKMKESTAHLNAYLADRDAYAKKHNMKLK